MSPEEIEIIRYGKLSGRTQAETFGALASFRSSQQQAQPAKGFLGTVGQTIKEIPSDLSGAFQGMKGAVTRGIETGREARQQVEMGEISPQAGTVKTIGAGLGAGAGALFEGGLGVAKSFLPKQTEEAIGEKVGQAVGAVVDTKAAQGVINKYESLAPEQKALVDGLLGTADGLTTMFGVPTGTRLTGSAVRGTNRAVSSRIASAGQRVFDTKTKTIESLKDLRQNYPQRFEEVRTFIAQSNINTENPVSTLKDAYQSSFISDNKTLTKKLQDTAIRANTTPDALLQKVAERGYLPKVDGKLSDFTDSFENIKTQQRAIIDNEVLPKVNAIQGNFSLDGLAQRVDEFLRQNTRGADLDKALTEMNRIFASYRTKYGTDNLTPAQVNRIRVDMNSGTDAYKRAGFEIDTEDAIAKAIRAEFDRIDPSIREANAKWADLQEDRRILSIMHNQPVNMGMLAGATGRLLGTIVASGAGLSVAGPGGLVIAGAAAALGSDFIVNALRQRKFAPQIRDAILRDLNKNPKIKDEFLRETTPTNRQYIEQELLRLPPPSKDSPQSAVYTPIGLPETGGVAKAGTPIERTRAGAIRRSDSQPRPTVTEEVILRDKEAVEQALSEMELELSGALRPSVGENLVKSPDGGYYRFNELPSWIPKNLRDGDLMARVLRNIQSGKRPRSNASQEIELQDIVEFHIKNRVEELKNKPLGTPNEGVFSGDVAFAAAIMAGGTYFVMSEDGGFLPVVAPIALMANPVSRQATLKAAKRIAEQGGKMPQSYKRLVAEALDTYDTGFMDIRHNGRKVSIPPDDIDVRIAEIKAKNERGIFTDKDALEAEELMANKGIVITREEPFNQGATPATTTLDPKNFKTAEEYVKAQGTPLYHGTPFGEKVTEIKMGGKGGYFGDGVYLTRQKEVASRFTKLESANPILEARGDGNFTNINTGEIVKGGKPAIIETTLPKDIKLKPMTEPEMSKEIEAFRQPNGAIDLDGARNAIRDKYAKQGYDGFEVEATKYFNEPQTVIFPNSVSKIKTRTQLIDEWKKANQ